MSTTSVQQRNRRAFVRRQTKRTTKVSCRKGTMDFGPNLAIGVLDVSETGARLVLRQPVETNAEVTVTFEGMFHTRPIRLVGRVIWSVETAAGTYCIGVQFDKRLAYLDVTKIA